MSSFFSSWFSSGSSNTSPSGDPSSTSTCPVAHDKPNTQQSPQNASAATPQAESRCPVDHKNMPPPQDHPFLKAQEVLRPGLERGLSTEREISSIPRLMGQATGAGTGAARGCPVPHEDRQQDPSASGHSAPNASQDSRESNWVYPSPAQFYAALQRKHRTEANASDMSIVVPVHNAVNEKCWADVLKWEMNEAQAQQEHVKLVSFKGRPQDLTPRARLYSLLGYAKPFDRHDWVVDRDGKRVRYVIDFYAGKAGPLSFFLDVRPALDDFDAVALRTKRFWSKFLPQQPQSTPPSQRSAQ